MKDRSTPQELSAFKDGFAKGFTLACVPALALLIGALVHVLRCAH